ncbi:MAG: 2-oxo-4-hydroxy-4-carboxy-5-ureidoimidazoline decarboxylase [Trueperaceae bacterium]|nr:MAG: 2-oxo-4-hydroxy-4-carboxy-5-ureidoimidazoline decarboxylase [Trueperaceae bacterium]
MDSTSLTNLNSVDRKVFVALLDGIFEHSPWVAERAYSKRPFHSLEALHQTMVSVVAESGVERQLDLICAHPDLAGKAALAQELTDHSQREQASAGLDRLTPEEYARFHRLNESYRSKFGFPFILAVKGHTKHSILDAFESRLPNDEDAERQCALREIAKIARFRLEERLTG